MTAPIHYVGIDLGSYQTAAAASNGRRSLQPTCVGWSRDHVARSMLGADVVYGNDAVNNRLAVDFCRPFAHGALKYLDESHSGLTPDASERSRKAARLIVEHVIASTRPAPEARIVAVVGSPSRASLSAQGEVLSAVSDACQLSMVVPEPFAVAYGMDRLAGTLVIDIGAGTVDLCAMHGSLPSDEDQATLPLGGDAIDAAFIERLTQRRPGVELSLAQARSIKERLGFVRDEDQPAVAEVYVEGKPEQLDVTEPLREACRIVVEPIVEAASDLIGRYDPEFRSTLLGNVILAGGGSQLRGLDRLIESALQPYGNPTVTRVADSAYAGCEGALKLALDMPAEMWDQLEAA